MAYYQTGKYRLSIADFDQAIQLDPGYAFAFSRRGLAYDQLQDIDRARLYTQTACSLDSRFCSSLIIAAPTEIPVPATTATPQTHLGPGREIIIFETSALSIESESRLSLQSNNLSFKGAEIGVVDNVVGNLIFFGNQGGIE